MWKVEETRFERNWTTFVKKGFWAAWKSPAKMVVSNRPCRIQSQGCFFVSARWGKSKKRVFIAIGLAFPSSEKSRVDKGRPKWWYETDLVEFDPKRVFSLRPDGESRKNAFSTQLDDLRQPFFFRCLQKATQNGGMKPTSWNSIPSVSFRFAPMGKVEKTCFKRNWRTFVSPVFALLGIPKPKWWYETDLVEFDPKGVFSFRPDGESPKNAFSPQLDDVRQPAFLRCLEKPTQNGGMKPTSWNSIPMVFFRFATMGKVEKTRFERNWTTFVIPDFTLLGKVYPKWWYETDLVELDPKRVFSFRSDGKVEKTRFQRNWTTFVNPAFCAAWKSPPKMVLWNRPRGIWCQGCFFVSPRWGKSKKCVFNAIGRPSSTLLFALLEKALLKWWYETDLVKFDAKGVFSFRLDRESLKNACSTQLDDLS